MKTLLLRRLRPLVLVGASAVLIGCGETTQGQIPPSQTTSSGSVTGTPGPAVETRSVPTPPATPALVVTAVPGTPTPSAREVVPEKLREIVKLADAKVAPEVILAFINRSETDYVLTADEVLLLRRHGLDEGLIAAMVRKPVESPAAKVEQQVAGTPTPAPAPAAPVVPEAVPVVVTPAPAPPVAVPTQTVVVQQPVQAVTVQYFQESLSPYGTWIQVDGIGLCWQPSIVRTDATWRPYYHGGRWVYSSAGWYWQSDYNWGWAAFHYGRWNRHARHGWVWCPDTVWAPAWVSWRHSQDYFGWAPLPWGSHYQAGFGLVYQDRNVGISFGFGLGHDDFCFVPARRFCDPTPWRHGIGQRERQIVFSQTTVINNFVSGSDNVIINEGIGRSRVASATGQRLDPVHIRRLPAREHNGSRADSLVDGGRSIGVYRPPLVEEAARQKRPVAGRPPFQQLDGSTASRDKSGPAQGGRASGGGDIRSNPTTGRPTSQPMLPAQPNRGQQPVLPRDTANPGARSEVRGATPALTVPRLVESPTVSRQATPLPTVQIRPQPQPAVTLPPPAPAFPRGGRNDPSARSGRAEVSTQPEVRREQQQAPAPSVVAEDPTRPATSRGDLSTRRLDRPTPPTGALANPSNPSGRETVRDYTPSTRPQPGMQPRLDLNVPTPAPRAPVQVAPMPTPTPRAPVMVTPPPVPALPPAIVRQAPSAPQASPDNRRQQPDAPAPRSGRDRN